MTFYILFFLTLAFTSYQAFRSREMHERLLFSVLFLFVVFTFTVHPWIARSTSRWLRFFEIFTLSSLFVWLAAKPLMLFFEARKRGRRSLFLLRNGKGPLVEMIDACRMLAEARQGGLIAIQRKDPLESWTKSGIPMEARIRKETIFSIFTPPGALHDGGMVIQNDRIAAAGVLFPLSKRLDLPTELGTRHRAGLGLSEATDALSIIVSEETGKISLADRGTLLYDVKSERLSEMLETALKKRLIRKKKFSASPGRETSNKTQPISI